MAISEFAKNYHEKMFPERTQNNQQPSAQIKDNNTNTAAPFAQTDPEFIEFFDNFAFDEVINEKGQELDDKTRFMAILATLLGCLGIDEFKVMLKPAMNFGVTPVEIKEITYQATAYLGIGRVYPFLRAVNEVLQAEGVKLPLEAQGSTNPENRREAGTQAQVDIFGKGMKDFWKSGSEEVRHINRWLASNCFGDYYTRSGLDFKQREMVTFCFLAAQGGCEPQLTSHAAANMKIGNNKAILISVVSQCLPYIGYPRSLNAIACINKAAESA